jgi:hypothetical protein
MNRSGLGLSNRPGSEIPGPRTPAATPAATGARGWLHAHRQVVALSAAGVVLLAGAGSAVLLLTGGSDSDLGGSAAASATGTGRASATPTTTPNGRTAPGAGATGTATGSPTGTRNPFAPRPSGSSTATGTGSPGTSGSATGTTAAVTTTVTNPAVYLALFSVAADGKAAFSVNGTTYSQHPGDTFGDGKAFSYHKSVKVAGVTCASVGYLDQTVTVCPGEMHQIG